MKISWQITGIRKDAFAERTKMTTESYKPVEERGKYMHPEAFGYGIEKSVNEKHHLRDIEADNALLK